MEESARAKFHIMRAHPSVRTLQTLVGHISEGVKRIVNVFNLYRTIELIAIGMV